MPCRLTFMNIILLSLWVCTAGSAFGAMNFPSVVEFERKIYFQTSGGEPVQIKAGIYEVEEQGEEALNLVPVGLKSGSAIPIQAIPAAHDQEVESATAHVIPSPDNHADTRHLVLWLPNGLALEAVGSYSGVFSRSALTWSQNAKSPQKADSNPLLVSIEKPTYFKTIGGDPVRIEPGAYEVGLVEGGLSLMQMGEGEKSAVMIESESLGTSMAVLLPDFNDNTDLEMLMLSTAEGHSIVAMGSHSGAFPRGLWKKLKKATAKVARSAKGVGGKVKKGVKKAAKKSYRFTKGQARKYGRKAIRAGKKKVDQYLQVGGIVYDTAKGLPGTLYRGAKNLPRSTYNGAKTMSRDLYRLGKGVVKKVCGSKVRSVRGMACVTIVSGGAGATAAVVGSR